MATLLQCPNCSAPLPPPGSGHATCRFCGATSIVKGGKPTRASGDPIGARALALDFKAQHGVDVSGDAHERELDAKTMASIYAFAKKLG